MFGFRTFSEPPLYVPDGSVAAYAAHEEWGKFNRIAGISIMNSPVEAPEADNTGSCEIYNLRRERMEACRETLAPGIYIERYGAGTRKIVVE